MAKGKLEKFEELKGFGNVLEPRIDGLFQEGHSLMGKWREECFAHDGPLFLELACGKGEYCVELARRYPEANFLGIDIKGNRIWRGAKESLEEGLTNVFFIRTRVEFVDSFFAPEEVDGIWLTFPDPQEKKKRAKKRLTGPAFLDRYLRFLKKGGRLHLKTDNSLLYRYTQQVLRERGYPIERDIPDVHGSAEGIPQEEREWLMIRTFYEKLAIESSKTIKYLRFRLR